MTTPDTTIARLIEDDHERLKGLVAALSDEIAGEPPAPFDPWKLSLLRTLRDFQNELRKHFDFEEHGGFMDEVVSHAPHYHSRVEALVREHEALVASLDAILSDLKAAGTPAMWRASRIPTRLGALFDVLKAHESNESGLLHDTYFQDLGAGG